MADGENNVWENVANDINNSIVTRDAWNDYQTWRDYDDDTDWADETEIYCIIVRCCNRPSRLELIKNIRNVDEFYYHHNRGLYEYKCMIVDQLPCCIYDKLDKKTSEIIYEKLYENVGTDVGIEILNINDWLGRKNVIKKQIDKDFETQNYEEWDEE